MTLEQLVVIIKAETAQLEKAIDRVKGQLSSLDTVASKVGNKITRSFSKTASGLSKTFKALGIGALSAGIIAFGKSAINAASDLEEWQNVVAVAFGDATSEVDNFAKQAISQFGLSELAAKQLAGTFKAMADGIGLNDAAGRKMAIQLTGLAADMASFYNTTTDATKTALEGVFTGQTRALKQYGIVMTEATLEAYRMERGITTAYSAMSEAQRVALRYNYVLHSAANAQNDFARTSTSWANQMRLLANNWNQLITTIGSGLIRVLQPVLVILNKILSTLIAVVNAIAKVFGGKGITSIGSGSGLGGMADDLGGVEDGFNDANKAAKKFRATVAGFDELERLNAQPEDSGAMSGLGGMGDVGVDDLDSYFDLEGLDDTLNKFEEWFQKIKDLMDADNWEGVGAELAKVLNSWMKTIDDWILNVFEPFGVKWADRIARVLNGLVAEYDWELLGKLLADGLNALIHIANTFLERFDALELGKGIGRTINSWFNTVDWEGLGHFFANRLNFIIDVAAGFFDKFITQAYENGQKLGTAFNAFIEWIHWENLSRAIWEGLNSLAQIIQGFVDMVKWDELKTKVGNALQDIFDNLDMEGIKTAIADLVNHVMDFLTSLDWYQIGHTVGEMLSGVDWLGVLMDVKDKIIWPAVKGFWDGLMSDGKNLLLGWVGKIKSFFSAEYGPMLGLAIGVVFGIITKALSTVGKAALTGWFAQASMWAREHSQLFLSTVGEQLGFSVKGFASGLGKLFQPIKDFFAYTLPEIFKAPSYAGTGLKAFFTDIGTAIKSMNPWVAAAAVAILSLTSSYGGLGGVLERVGKVFSDTVQHVKDFANSIGFTDKVNALKEAFSNLVKPFQRIYEVLGMLKPVWEVFFTTLTGIATTAINTVVGVISGLVEVLSGIVNIVAGVLGLLVDLITGNFTQLRTDIETIWTGIVQFFQGIWDAIIGGVTGFVEGVIQWFKDLKYNLIGDPIVIDMCNGIFNIFSEMLQNILGIITEWIDGVIALFQQIKASAEELFTAIKTKLEEIWTAVKEFAIETWNAIKEFLETTWTAIKTCTENLWTELYNWLNTLWTNLTNLVRTTWENLKTIISTAWTWIKTTTNTIWNEIKTLLTTLWENIKTMINNALNAVKTAVTNAWNAIKTTTSTVWNALKSLLEGIWNSIASTANTITTTIGNYFVNAYNRITSAWSAFSSFWHGVWDGAANVVRSAVNGVIGVLNSFSITNPFTGATYGFSIPYLANGGVISSPTLAMVGEYTGARSNPEIVAPENKIREIISSENGEMVSALYQIARQIIDAIDDVDMTVSIGDDTIAQAANRGNNAYKKRTGKPLFSM